MQEFDREEGQEGLLREGSLEDCLSGSWEVCDCGVEEGAAQGEGVVEMVGHFDGGGGGCVSGQRSAIESCR